MGLIKLLKKNKIRFDIKENELIIYKDVILSYSKLKKLPDYPITFLGDVNLAHSQIEYFPDYSITFCGDVDLSYTQLKELPDNMVFNENVNLSYTQIKELPDNMTVEYNLIINDNLITKIPKKLKAGWIYIDYENELDIAIRKDGMIRIGLVQKSISDWKKSFKEDKFCKETQKNNYVIKKFEKRFNNAVKLLKTWNS